MRRLTVLTASAVMAMVAITPSSAASASEVEALRLDCRAQTTDSEPVVRCAWSEPRTSAATGVKLFRLDPAVDDQRQVVYRSGDLSQTGFTDTHVRAGHRYVYAVVAFNSDGRVVARSRAEWVRVPTTPDVEVLRLQCELGPARAAIGCEWSRPETRDAAVVTLWRSVDGGEREIVERFRPSGPTAYRDRVPAAAERIVYAVIATDRAGDIVARSRAEAVRIPEIDAAPSRPIARPERANP
jgi:hypothetical protein